MNILGTEVIESSEGLLNAYIKSYRFEMPGPSRSGRITMLINVYPRDDETPKLVVIVLFHHEGAETFLPNQWNKHIDEIDWIDFTPEDKAEMRAIDAVVQQILSTI
jgi:hypothetical protein